MSALFVRQVALFPRRTPLVKGVPHVGRAFSTELPPSGKMPPNPREKRYEQKNVVFGAVGIVALLCAFYLSVSPRERKSVENDKQGAIAQK